MVPLPLACHAGIDVLLCQVQIAALEFNPSLGVPDVVQEDLGRPQVLKAKIVEADVAQLRLHRIDRRIGVLVRAFQLHILFRQRIGDVVPGNGLGARLMAFSNGAIPFSVWLVAM